jgi:hypothetical protein
MKKLLLSLVAILGLAVSANATVVIAQYNFDGNNFVSSDSDSSTAGNIVPTGYGTKSVIVAGGPAGSSFVYNVDHSDAPQGTGFNIAKYLEFTVTSGGNYINASQLTFAFATANTSSTISWELRSSVDNYVTQLGTGTTIGTTFTTQTANFSIHQANTVTFRLYFANVSSNPDLLVDNINLFGDTVTPVPEPTNIALVLFGCTFAGVGAGRKFLKKKTA